MCKALITDALLRATLGDANEEEQGEGGDEDGDGGAGQQRKVKLAPPVATVPPFIR